MTASLSNDDAIDPQAPPWQRHFARILRAEREAAGKSLRELAHDAGIYWVELMRYERAEQEPNIAHIYILADLLHTSIHRMLPANPHLELNSSPSGQDLLSRQSG